MGVSIEAEIKESRISRFLARRYAVPLVIAGAVTVVTLACLAPELIARWQLARERDAIRACGEPATLAELGPEMPPDEDNAAVLLNAVVYAKSPEYELFLSDGHETHRAGTEKGLALNGQAMKTVREALTRPRCVYGIDYKKGMNTFGPRLPLVRAFARLFSTEAFLHGLDGKGAEAADSIRQIFLLARATDEEQIILAKLTALGITWIGMKALREVDDMGVLGDDERRLLVKLIASLDFETMATEAMISERARSGDACDAMAGNVAGTGAARRGWISRWLSTRNMRLSPRERLTAMRLGTAMVEASRLPPWEARPVVEARYRELWALHTWLTSVAGLDESWKLFYVSFMRAIARRDTAVIGLSCELFRSARGRYPTALNELTPEFLKALPPDPFMGTPLTYTLREDGRAFIVYSLGANLKDDGGVKKRPAKDDVSWEGRGRGE
jgi:hypothetical protein